MGDDPSIQNSADTGDTYSSIEKDIPAPAPAAAVNKNFPTTGLAIGAALGLLSSIGKQNADRARSYAAATQTAYSPWTRMGLGQMPQQEAGINSVAGLGASGAALQQGLQGGSMAPAAYMMNGGQGMMNPYMMGGGYGR